MANLNGFPICKWCERPVHRGRCTAWWKAHPTAREIVSIKVRNHYTNETLPLPRKPKSEWTKQMDAARAGLEKAFQERTDMDFWIARIRFLLETKGRD